MSQQSLIPYPAFVHSWLDDLGLSPEVFRVYCHLVRRVGRNEYAWPSMQSIGDTCFGTTYKHPDTRRKHAIAAVAELESRKLVRKEKQYQERRQTSNRYYVIAWPQFDGTPPADDSSGQASNQEPMYKILEAPEEAM